MIFDLMGFYVKNILQNHPGFIIHFGLSKINFT